MNKTHQKRKPISTRKNRTQKGGYERTVMYVHKAPALDYKDNIGTVSGPIPASSYNSHIATKGGNRKKKTRKNNSKK